MSIHTKIKAGIHSFETDQLIWFRLVKRQPGYYGTLSNQILEFNVNRILARLQL